MSMPQISRTLISRLQTSRPIRRIVGYPGASTSPSEQAIRSIDDIRSTPRW